MDAPVSGFPDFGTFSILFVVFSVMSLFLFLCVVGLIIFLWVKTYQGAQKQGVDPLAVPGQIAGRLATSELLAPTRSVEARLLELDDLHARGVVTDEEHRSSRARILGGP